MLTKYIAALSITIGLFSCQNSGKDHNLRTGNYILEMDLGDTILEIPVTYNTKQLVIHNGSESITLAVSVTYDSIIAPFGVFDAGIELQSKSDSTAKGLFIKYYKDDYTIPVKIRPSSSRSILEDIPSYNEAYQVTFSPKTPDAYPAKGMFLFQEDGSAYGTFATETGDYRFLYGSIKENKFKLNTLDGSHAFIFTGETSGDSITNGMFYSGTHWKESWLAVRNDTFELTSPDSISSVNNPVHFSFLDTDSSLFSFDENSYQDTAVIIQILGSWCPNCLDETEFLSKLQADYSDEPLMMIGIAFESKLDFSYYQKQINRLKENTGITYPVLFGGKASKQIASDTLTFVDEIKSFPTTIFLDKNHKVMKVHTGFYGPGTGDYYSKFKEETYLLMDKIFRKEK